MNLIVRLLYVVLASLRRARLGVLDESVTRFRVLPTDLDVNGHMNNGRYLTVMDLGRVDLFVRSGLAGAMRRNRWSGVVASMAIRFRRPLDPFRRYELRSRVIGWDDRWFFLEQRFVRGNEAAAHAVVKVQLSSRGGRVAPQTVVDALPHPAAPPPLPPALADWQSAEHRLVSGEPAPSRA